MSSTITALTSGGGLAMAGDTSGQLELKTNNGTTAVTVDTSQNVGIGTGSPSRKLTVYATGSSVPAVITNDQTQARLCFKDSVTALDYTVGIGSIGENLASYTGGTERMRIDSSGNVGINSTNPAYKLTVIGNAYVDTYLGIGVAPANTAVVKIDAPLNARDGIGLSTNQSPASGSFISFRNLSGNVAGSITHTGTTTVAYNTSSDYRLKENIAPMTGALAKVAALKPCTYTWKEDGTDGQGFIAHELAEICPQAVTFEKDAVDADGNPKYQGVDTSFLVATLTAAIQELNAKVDAQAAEIAALKGAK